jgi:hypothetical protein
MKSSPSSKLNKIHMLRDDDAGMACILLQDVVLWEGDTNELRDEVPRLLRKLGFSVTEEGYTYE